MRLFILVGLLLLVSGLVAGASDYPPTPEGVTTFVQDFLNAPLQSAFWSSYFILIISYIVAPLLLTFLLLYAILDQLRLFGHGQQKLHFILAFLLTLFAAYSDILLRMSVFLVNIGTLAVFIAFTALVLGLLVSQIMRKKAENFGFFFGSRFLSNFIIHSPLGIFLVLIGMFVPQLVSFPDIGSYLYLSLAFIGLAAFITSLSYRRNTTEIVVTALLFVGFQLYLYFAYSQASAIFAAIGFALYLLYLGSGHAKRWYARERERQAGRRQGGPSILR